MSKAENPNKTKVPPLVMQHSESGIFVIGDQKPKEIKTEDGKPGKELRIRDVGLHAAQGGGLRLFKDGGFEIRSSTNTDVRNVEAGSVINQVCPDAPLAINSLGDIKIEAAGTLTIRANKIVMEGIDEGQTAITMLSKHDINIRANNNFIVTADNITHDAKERILSHSEGWNTIIAQCFRVHEPVSKLIPGVFKAYIEDQIQTLKD